VRADSKGSQLNIHQSNRMERAPRSNLQRRRDTEATIIDAFEQVLVRDGVAGLGINAIVKEAKTGKKQLYDYFGGLAGLATAWVEQRGIWPPLEDIIGEPMTQFDRREPAEKLRIVNRNCASMLRRNAPLCELLTGEFVRSPEVKDAVDHVRQLVRRDFERVLNSDPVLSRDDYLALNMIAYAATTYLALRAHSQPRFFGFDLSTETSWQVVLNMFDRVMDNADRGIATAAAKAD
jgi:AcrR family transcriptional regulator